MITNKVEIVVIGGKGGDGKISFRHEKFVPFGGPDGGDGGDGGDIYIKADRGITNLGLFRRKRKFKAEFGKSGGRQKKYGARGTDLVITVPLGTMVFSKEGEQDVLLADLNQQGQSVMVANGGRGGSGNVHFATSRNQAPRIATKGGSGEERCLILDLKLIADVGIIGYPNVGKSTLLSAVSKATPKIANYPFTTREPALGVVDVGMETITVAEIPGLIEGAHLGRGLGHDFLCHIERTKILLHLLDGSSKSVIDDMNNINTELALYKPALVQEPQIVAVNKVDLSEVQAQVGEVKRAFDLLGMTCFFISAHTGQGVPELVAAMAELVGRVNKDRAAAEVTSVIFRPKPRSK